MSLLQQRLRIANETKNTLAAGVSIQMNFKSKTKEEKKTAFKRKSLKSFILRWLPPHRMSILQAKANLPRIDVLYMLDFFSTKQLHILK